MKNKCPYIDCCDRCTHKIKPRRPQTKHIPDCPYNNPKKCPMYVDWLKSLRKANRELPTTLRSETYEGHRV